MPAISIIVPIYNMEHLMRRCIDSLLSQTFTDYELLLIDDGSKDGSWRICQEYAHKDVRISIFHKENGGLSDARNYGLSKAIGKYTIFADPDDWVEPTMLAELYQKAKETDADMVICDYWENGQTFQKRMEQRPSSLDAHTVLRELFTHLHGSTSNKLIRRYSYQKYDVHFPKDINYCEDLYVCASFLKNEIKVAYLPKAFYHYYNDTGKESLSRHYDKNTLKRDLQIRKTFDRLLSGTDVRQRAINMLMASTICRAFYFGRNLFSSRDFRNLFYTYRHLFKEGYACLHERPFMYLGCCGYYHVMYPIFKTVVFLGTRLKNIRRFFLAQ